MSVLLLYCFCSSSSFCFFFLLLLLFFSSMSFDLVAYTVQKPSFTLFLFFVLVLLCGPGFQLNSMNTHTHNKTYGLDARRPLTTLNSVDGSTANRREAPDVSRWCHSKLHDLAKNVSFTQWVLVFVCLCVCVPALQPGCL